jgi:putative membrane protein
MRLVTFFDTDGKRVLTDAVRRAEQKTSGEIVVVVCPASGRYRHVDLAVGTVVSFAILCVFLYHPAPFDFTYLPLELAAAFAVGALACLAFRPLKRVLVLRASMAREVRRAAREAFVDQGVHRTRRRTGILAFVSVFERRVDLVPDVGVDVSSMQQTWDGVHAALERAVRRGDVDAFAEGVVALGGALAAALPHTADDVNELPDAPQEVA